MNWHKFFRCPFRKTWGFGGRGGIHYITPAYLSGKGLKTKTEFPITAHTGVSGTVLLNGRNFKGNRVTEIKLI